MQSRATIAHFHESTAAQRRRRVSLAPSLRSPTSMCTASQVHHTTLRMLCSLMFSSRANSGRRRRQGHHRQNSTRIDPGLFPAENGRGNRNIRSNRSNSFTQLRREPTSLGI